MSQPSSSRESLHAATNYSSITPRGLPSPAPESVQDNIPSISSNLLHLLLHPSRSSNPRIYLRNHTIHIKTMVQFFDSLSDSLRDWALKQQIFFIASAPRYGKHVNVSPKGLPASTFTVLDPNTACYIDATGSGAETIAHLYETGRATVMFCSFDKTPRIMRLFCMGRVVEFDREEYKTLLERMRKEHVVGARAVIVLHIFKVSMDFCQADRTNYTVQSANDNLLYRCKHHVATAYHGSTTIPEH